MFESEHIPWLTSLSPTWILDCRRESSHSSSEIGLLGMTWFRLISYETTALVIQQENINKYLLRDYATEIQNYD